MVPRVDHALPRPFQRDNIEEEENAKSAVPNKIEVNDVEYGRATSATSSMAASFPQSRETRPENPRSSTDPSPALLLQGWFKDKDKHESSMRPSSSHARNRSPYSRSHLRSRSSGAALLSAPLMTRAHSMPNPHTSRPFEQNITSSPLGGLSPSPSPLRARSPSKRQEEASQPPRSPSWYESSFSGSTGIEAIQEDSELDITPRAQSAPIQAPLPIHSSRSASSLRRRPASPLHSTGNVQPPTSSFPASVIDQQTPLNMTAAPPSTSGSNSPALGPQKYNESYPSQTLHHYSSTSSISLSFSSIPSTPTSARSRSPSISSLDTIEDAPEEEETKAVEEERILRLKLAAEREERGEASDGEESGPRRRNGSLDVPRGFGFRGGGRERKRWSICGGERRGDLDLETIWED